MNIRQLGKLVDYLWARGTDASNRAHMPVMIWGETGIGKSETVKERTQSYEDADFIDLRLGTQDVGDLIGMPRIQDVFPDPIALARKKPTKLFTKQALIHHLASTYPDQFREHSGDSIWEYASANIPVRYKGEQRMVYAIPEWFPEPNTRGVLFLDELNRGQKDVLQAIFQLLLDRKLHMATLPQDWVIFAAINPSGDYGHVQWDPSDDRAFLSRFCHVALQPTAEEWLKYAYDSNVDTSITNLISASKKWLGKIDAVQLPDNIEPTPRTWVLFSRIGKPLISKVFEDRLSGRVGLAESDDQTILREMAEGFVGTEAFMNWWNIAFADIQPATSDEILFGWSTTRVKKMPDGSTAMDDQGKAVMLEPVRDRFQRIYDRVRQDPTKGRSYLHQLLRPSSDGLIHVFSKIEAEIEQEIKAGLDANSAVVKVFGKECLLNLTGQAQKTVVTDPVDPSKQTVSYKIVREGYFTDLMNWGMADELARLFKVMGMDSSSKDFPRIVAYLSGTSGMPMPVISWWAKQKGGVSDITSPGITSSIFKNMPKAKKDKMGGIDADNSEEGEDVLPRLLQR